VLILAGKSVTIQCARNHDRYGRTLARLRIHHGGDATDTIDVGAAVIARGFALPYRPRPQSQSRGRRALVRVTSVTKK
jgi:endonuclease YncB( thermonuclease family)